MKNLEREIFELLDKIKAKNASDPDHGDQEILLPENNMHVIQTLDDNVVRPLSPMLAARFDYASSWVNAHLDQNWLSLQEIKSAKSNETIREWIELRVENWGHVPPATVKYSQAALFAYNPYEPEETYLVWRSDNAEPEVWRYFGSDYKYFFDLKSFFEYVAGLKEIDDSGRMSIGLPQDF